MNIDRYALWEKVGYHPHPKQRLFHDSLARFKVPVCGRRFGKSKMAAMELLPELIAPESRGNRYWIVGPTYDLAEKEFRYLWDALVLDLKMGSALKRKANNVRTGEMFIEMPWGTRVDVKSADHPDGLVGEGLAGVIVSEAAKQKKVVWDKYLRPALADKRGWAIFPSTPEGYNWYYEDLYLRGLNEKEPEYESWNFPSWENPYVYPDGFEDSEVQGQMHGEEDPWFWQEIGADFRSFVGKIYTEWSDPVHVMTGDYEYNPMWDSYLWFDFGYANPFVCLDVQIDPSDTIYIWREYYVTELPVHKHAAELAGRTNPTGYNLRCGFGDAGDPGAVETLSSQLVHVIADSDAKDVVRGIQEVKKFLQTYYDESVGKQKSHIYVHKSCVNTIFEFQNYRMRSTLRDDEDKKEEPKKFNDHAMDAIRYGIMHLYVLGARYHLADVRTTAPNPTRPDPTQIDKVPTGVGGRSTFFRLEEGESLSIGKTRW